MSIPISFFFKKSFIYLLRGGMLLYIYIYFLLYNFVLFLWYIVSITEQLYCESSYNYIHIYPFTPEPPSLLPTLDSFFPFLFMSLLWGLACNRNGFLARVGKQGDERQQGNRSPLLTGKWKVACSRVPFAFFSLWQIRPVTVLHHTLCFYASSWSQPRTGLAAWLPCSPRPVPLCTAVRGHPRALPRSGAPLGLFLQEGAPLISVKPECVCSLKKSARILRGCISIRRTIWFFFKISWVISVTNFKKAMLQNSVQEEHTHTPCYTVILIHHTHSTLSISFPRQ